MNLHQLFSNEEGKRALQYLLLASFIFGFIIPAINYMRPFGTDTYTHIETTNDMYASSSLYQFYTLSAQNTLHPKFENNLYNYPFGIWLFTSITAKITGTSPYFIAFILPIIMLITVASSFYLYLKLFFKSPQEKMLGLLFLFSMVDFTTNLLSYRPSIFTIPFVLLLVYFTANNDSIKKSIFYILISSFILMFTHVGTFIFIMFFSIAFLLLFSLLTGKLHKKGYLLVTVNFLCYYVGMNLFPEILPQYKDKSRLLISTGESIASTLNMNFIREFSNIIYQKVFVEYDFIYIIFLLALMFSLVELIGFCYNAFARTKANNRTQYLAIPFIGNFQRMTHSIIAAPFWLGPLHVFFTLFGIIKLKKEHLVLFSAVGLVTILPGALSQVATGALREIFYLYLVIPVTSVLGLLYILELLKKYSILRRLQPLILLATTMTFILTPLVGNLYYVPEISHEPYQVNGMAWLNNYGNSLERIEGLGYRDIRVLTGKKTASDELLSGKESSTFETNLAKIYLRNNSEATVIDLYADYNLKYYLVSEKIVENLRGNYSQLQIQSNTELDNIYNSLNFFIYTNPTKRVTYPNVEENTGSITFKENSPAVQDIGPSFLVETGNYKIKLNKLEPTITSLNDGTNDLLGEGYFLDYMRISWYGGGSYGSRFAAYSSGGFPKFTTTIKNNKLIYTTVLDEKTQKENWSTMSITYTFYEESVKREFYLSNDWVSSGGLDNMNLLVSTMLFLPSRNFSYSNYNGKNIEKNVYPSDDDVRVNEKFRDIYFKEENTGIYLRYDDTSPLPESISFRGLPIGEYASYRTESNNIVYPSESLQLTQYIAVGELDVAKSNVEKYTKTKLYQYPNGKIPLVLVSCLKETNPVTQYGEEVFQKSITAYDNLNKIKITNFTEGIDAQEEDINQDIVSKLKSSNIDIVGSTDVFKGSSFDSFSDQETSIFALAKNANYYYNFNISGFIPKNLKYNLDTVRILDGLNTSFLISNSVRTPIYDVYHEGLRHPQFAFYKGQQTNLILLPPTAPESDSIRGSADVASASSAWINTMKSTTQNDDVSVFLWRSEDLGNELYFDAFNDSISYALKNGLSMISPKEIAHHFKLLNNVSLVVEKDFDSVKIQVINGNPEAIKGVTIKTLLPRLEKLCNYSSSGGKIVRKYATSEECAVYISADLSEGESKVIDIYPEIKKDLIVDFENPQLQGDIHLTLKDSAGVPIRGVIVQINNSRYSSDENGVINTYLRKGDYTVIVGKAGFTKKTFTLNVVDKIGLLERNIKIETIIVALVLLIIGGFFISRSRYLKKSN